MKPLKTQASYALLSDLTLEIDDVEFKTLTYAFGPDVTKFTTVVVLHGRGFQGSGEDVTPFEPAHQRVTDVAGEPTLRGSFTLASFSRHLDGPELYPRVQLPPLFPRTFRRWAFESAALDLALRQAEASLADILQRDSRPMRFVNSPRLGADPVGVISRRLEMQPELRFKLDPSPA